jgi:hypothetical protein
MSDVKCPACSADLTLIRVRGEDRAHLLHTVLSVLPPGHELRVRIESPLCSIGPRASASIRVNGKKGKKRGNNERERASTLLSDPSRVAPLSNLRRAPAGFRAPPNSSDRLLLLEMLPCVPRQARGEGVKRSVCSRWPVLPSRRGFRPEGGRHGRHPRRRHRSSVQGLQGQRGPIGW